MKTSLGFLFVFLFILLSCKKEDTSWNSAYKLILVNDTLDIQNLFKDSIFTDDGTGNTKLVLDKQLIDYNVFSLINLRDTTIVQKNAIGVNSLSVSAGYTFISNSEEQELQMGDIKLTRVSFSSGKILLSVTNPYETKVFYQISLPYVRKNGVPLQRSLELEKGTRQNPTKKSVEIDVSGYDLNLTGLNNNSYNKIPTALSATSDPTGPGIVATNYDTTTFTAQFKDIKMSYARGYFGNEIRNVSFNKELGFFNKVSGIVAIDQYNFDLEVTNTAKVEGQVVIQNILNKNISTNTQVNLQNPIIGTPILLQSATGNTQQLNPTKKIFHFDISNSNLSNFIANLGSQFLGNISLQLNPNGNTNSGWDEIFQNSGVQIRLKADMPIRIGLSDFIFRDTLDFKLDNQTNKTHLKKGKFILKVSNAYPIDLLASMILLDKNGNQIGQLSSSDRIKSSTEGNENFKGINFSKSEITMELPENLAAKLSQVENVVFIFKANTFSNSIATPKMTNIPYNAFISVKLFGDFDTQFKF